jgi:DNA polymerase-3 subunit epsilon
LIDWDETVFCAVDTETTGVEPDRGDRIIEIAIVPIYKGKVIVEKAYVSLINPMIRIPAVIEKIHGISNSEVSKAPSMETVYPTIAKYFSGMIPVFHNGRFDLMFLDYAAKEIGSFPLDPYYIDTYEMSKVVFGKAKSLEWLARYFSVTDKVNHRALDDAIVTARVFVKLSQIIGVRRIGEFLLKWDGIDVKNT